MYRRLLSILLLIFLIACSHVEKNKRVNTILSQFANKKITIVTIGSKCNDGCMEFVHNLSKSYSNITSNIYNDTDEDKATALKQALLNDENDIVWALRGGYGTANIVELLYSDEEFLQKIKKKTKVPYVIGYCDITALHLFLSQEFGWKTVHGSVITELTNKDKSIGNFCTLNGIVNGIHKLTFVGLQPLNNAARNIKEISGQITGGNISIIQTSIGTRWQINTKNKILFLEDWKEKPYKITRMLHHMKMAGLLNDVRAIVIGYIGSQSEPMQKYINEFLNSMFIPIYSVDVLGHDIYNYPIIYNSDGIITVKNNIIKLNINF